MSKTRKTEEESKDYWYLNCNGDVIRAVYKSDDLERSLIAIGNYFESPEEAEKAVEKLEAWKRLKDFGCGFILDDHFAVKFIGPDARKVTSAEEQKSLSNAYKLLFVGKE